VELNRLGDAGLPAPLLVISPLARQVQSTVDPGSPPRTGIAQEHPDLAILNPASRPTVLPRHATRLGALLQEAGLVDHRHPVRVAQFPNDLLAEVPLHGISIPDRPIQHSLDRPRMLVAAVLRELPAILPLHLTEQSCHVRHRMPMARSPAKMVTQPAR